MTDCVIRLFMPIGREGWDISGPEAASLVASGEIVLCHQCSTPEREIYHDVPAAR